MPDDMKHSGPVDTHPINVNEDSDIAYWTKELGITELELRAAVDKVGLSADSVRQFVRGAR